MQSSASSRRSNPARVPHCDVQTRNRIVLDNLGLVKAIASRVHERVPPFVEYNDLAHAGILGLIDAAARFDPDQQTTFASYASYRIRGAILDNLRSLDWASRHSRRRQRRLAAAVRELSAELHRVPSDDEVANRLGIDDKAWRRLMMETVGGPTPDRRNSDQQDWPEPEYAADSDVQPEQICARSQMEQTLRQVLTRLRHRQRQVVTMYYMREMTMKEIGVALGVNESRVSQIHSDALRKMHACLYEAGIRSAAAF